MATTEQLMAQYGVAWFGFDEASGNVTDKLGLNNYIGTVTGATRTQGWNGEGNAISFSGSNQYVAFSSSFLPRGEKTIRFKVKTSQTTAGRILVDYTTSNSMGWFIHVLNSNLVVEFYLSSTSNYLISYPISDNFWHDVLLTYDQNILKLYVDDMIDYKRAINFTELNWTTNICRLGAGSIDRYFNGQLDDLQIYSKALSPSNFTQKRLAIKTTDNKNLAISSISDRVKEIPNTVEDILLAQGGVIREIDSAVDRPLIDLTKTTTEHEIANNTNSTLGSGKAFTVPINTNFKTIVIEDNY